MKTVETPILELQQEIEPCTMPFSPEARRVDKDEDA